MNRIIKKTLYSSFSILGISLCIWTLLLLNPKFSYANKSQIDFIEVYHNLPLETGTEKVLKDVIAIIKKSEIYNKDVTIQLCMNDDKVYPYLYPLVGGPLAYAVFNKTTIKNCDAKFNENIAQSQWAVNNNEVRKFNLTWLLAHEFTHNLQYKANPNFVIKNTLGSINWKLEGHAEYISREFKNDGLLKEKINAFILESQKPRTGLPVIDLPDDTKQIFSYYKYALIIQYLMEEKNMDYYTICESEIEMEDLYAEITDWASQ